MDQSSDFSIEVLDYIKKHEHLDPYTLSLKTSPFSDVDSRVIAQQVQGRRIARKKYPSLLNIDQYRYPPKVSLEQASSEATAIFKSKLVSGESFVDLTGGMGIDTFFIGRNFKNCTYIEPNEDLYKQSCQNFKYLGFDKVMAHNVCCEDFLQTNTKKYDWAFIDPSRRIDGSRKTSIYNYEPNIFEIQDLLLHLADNILIKLSPMQDISECIDVLHHVRRVWVLSVSNDVKELLLHLDSTTETPVQISAVNLAGDIEECFESRSDFRKSQTEVGPLQEFIYQPNAAIVKAGLQNVYADHLGLQKLHANTQLYTHKAAIDGFMGRVFKVICPISANKKEAHRIIVDKKVNVISKNYPLQPEEILKKLKLKNGGKDFLIAFSDYEANKRMVFCERLK